MSVVDLPYLGLEHIESWTGKRIEDEEAKAEGTLNLFQEGDVLFGKLRPYLAKAFRCSFDGLCSTEALVLRHGEKVNQSYLFYFLVSRQTIDLIDSSTYGAKMPRASWDFIGKIRFLLPSSDEQTLIARFLDQKTSQIDALIEQKEKLLKLLAEKRTAIITQAVTKGLDPDVEMRYSGIDWLGDVPQHWIVCHLKHRAKITYGVGGEIDTTLTEGIKLLSLPNVNKEGTFILDHTPFSDLPLEEAEELLLKKGDLLFNWRNGSSDHLGKTAYFDLDGEYLHVSFLLRLRFDQEVNNSKFFQYMLHSLRLTGFFTSSKAGVNNTFNQNELRNLWVMVPPLEEQNAIADFISSKIIKIDNVRVEIQKGIERLREYREALITAAVTGQIDVRKEVADE